MLFEINSNNSNFETQAFEYFNLPMQSMNVSMDRPSNVVDPSTGLALGNMYKNEYKQYKNYVQKKLVPSNERERMLLKIQELDFALNDLNLKLDVEPNNGELYNLFRSYAMELKNLCEKYAKEVEVLELIKDVNGKYTWINNPWPWDGGRSRV